MWLAGGALIAIYAFFLLIPVLVFAFVIRHAPLRL
jgi:hypothetical protein